jgi:hypothetical protein
MASKLTHPVIRRVSTPVPGFDIVELDIQPWDGEAESITFSMRQHRKDPFQVSMTLAEMFERLGLVATKEATKHAAGNLSGTVNAVELESAIMVDGDLTEEESAKLFNIVRAVQNGTWPDKGPAAKDEHE